MTQMILVGNLIGIIFVILVTGLLQTYKRTSIRGAPEWSIHGFAETLWRKNTLSKLAA